MFDGNFPSVSENRKALRKSFRGISKDLRRLAIEFKSNSYIISAHVLHSVQCDE